MKKYTIKYQEKGKEHNGVCYHYGDKTREEIIDFFGLKSLVKAKRYIHTHEDRIIKILTCMVVVMIVDVALLILG